MVRILRVVNFCLKIETQIMSQTLAKVCITLSRDSVSAAIRYDSNRKILEFWPEADFEFDCTVPNHPVIPLLGSTPTLRRVPSC